jgi:crossover junction endodeoxyribonuclease RuvC
MTVIGIDPGLKGGIVFMVDGRIAKAKKMPVVKGDGGSSIDFGEVAAMFRYEKPDIVAIEKVHSMPGQGVASVFTFGMGFGGLIGVCAGLGVSYKFVRPIEWQKKAFAGMDKKLGKGRSILYVKQRFPECEPIHKHDGLADAAIIAEYATLNF